MPVLLYLDVDWVYVGQENNADPLVENVRFSR